MTLVYNIPGVLILNQNKTFGRNTKNRLLYKCIPDDKSLGSILIPYEIKNMGFNKYFKNIFIIFKLDENNNTHGMIIQTIGPVDNLINYYEYQLYRKNIFYSNQQFILNTKNALNLNITCHTKWIELIMKTYPLIQNRLSYKVFSIDPSSSLDLDDAFSINKIDSNTVLISIYISNVSIWLEILNLYNKFGERISSIYMPDKVHAMLPSILSNNICSLRSNQDAIAFTMDIYVNNQGDIIEISYLNSLINPYQNYSYEESKLLLDSNYILLKEYTEKLLKKYSLLAFIEDSHNVVAYLMILMNHNIGKKLKDYQTGIFRTINISIDDTSAKPVEINNFIKLYNSKGSSYKIIDTNTLDKDIYHELLGLDAYVHITSPIRRLCDILNLIIFQHKLNLIKFSQNALDFYEKWINQIDLINIKSKSIRSVQRDASLLDITSKNPELLNELYDGYFIEEIKININNYKYNIYIPKLKIISEIKTTHKFKLFDKNIFKLYLFENEHKFKKKIRINII
jgi:exoribonuclease R